MPVNSTSKAYQNMAAIWERCRDVYAGGDAVKAKMTKYLPALEGSTDNPDGFKNVGLIQGGYAAYNARASFYPAGRRTVMGLTGLVFGHKITVEGVPKADEKQFDDVTQ